MTDLFDGRCSSCFLEPPLDGQPEGLCVACAAKRVADEVGVDVDLARGLASALADDERSTVYLANYVQKRLDPSTKFPDVDPAVAGFLVFLRKFAEPVAQAVARAREKERAAKAETTKKARARKPARRARKA